MKACIRFVSGAAVLFSSLLLAGICQPLNGQTIYTPYHFTTIAGSAGARGSGDGVGSAARFYSPFGVAVDSSGNVYVADVNNATIRKITPSVAGGMTTWTVTTLGGTAGVIGSADGTGAAARFCRPAGLYVDDTNTIYIYDDQTTLTPSGTALREITPAGVVTTIAFNTNGITYLGNSYNNGNATPPLGSQLQTILQQLYFASGKYVTDPIGNLIYVNIESDTGSIYEENGNSVLVNILMTWGGHADGPIASATDNITAARGGIDFSSQAGGLAVDGSGSVYVADGGNDLIRKITRTVTGGVESWYVTTLGGVPLSPGSSDGMGAAAQFNNPCGVAVDSSGNVYVADTVNNTIRIGTPYQAPVASNATIGAVLGQPITFTLPATDAEGFSITYSITGTTGGTATLAGNQATFTPNAAGNGTVTFTANDSYATSNTGTVTVTTILPQPEITLQANSQTVASGRSVAFNAIATGFPAPTYQWTLNGSTTIPGATNTTDSVLLISGATAADAGPYVCTATNVVGTATTSATLSVITTSSPGYLANLSSRVPVGTGSNILIAGFVISGTGSMDLLLRGAGPSLMPGPFSISNALSATQLTLYDSVVPSSPQPIVTNSGWSNPSTPGSSTLSVNPQAATLSLMNTLGAFTNNWAIGTLDSAVEVTPPAGAYTSQISGVGGTTGVALAEVYDADAYNPNTRLVNLSTRAEIGTGSNILIGGFVISGMTAETLLIRAVGPTLGAPPYNVPGTMAQPTVSIFSGGTPIYTNTGWGGDPTLTAVFATVGAFSLLSASSADSALLVTLPPGVYTAEVSGVNGGTGDALMEIYEVY